MILAYGSGAESLIGLISSVKWYQRTYEQNSVDWGKNVLKDVDMKPQFWGTAIINAAHLSNRTAIPELGMKKSHEAVHTTPSEKSKLWFFRYIALAH